MAVKTTHNKDQIFKIIRNHAGDIQNYGVSSLGLFGSVVRGEETAESDIDILVEYEEGQKNYTNFIELAWLLDHLLEKEVQLVTKQMLSKRLKNIIDKEIEYVSFDS